MVRPRRSNIKDAQPEKAAADWSSDISLAEVQFSGLADRGQHQSEWRREQEETVARDRDLLRLSQLFLASDWWHWFLRCTLRGTWLLSLIWSSSWKFNLIWKEQEHAGCCQGRSRVRGLYRRSMKTSRYSSTVNMRLGSEGASLTQMPIHLHLLHRLLIFLMWFCRLSVMVRISRCTVAFLCPPFHLLTYPGTLPAFSFSLLYSFSGKWFNGNDSSQRLTSARVIHHTHEQPGPRWYWEVQWVWAETLT